ncbi:MAG: hypothetical protein UHU19_05250 [Lachnospiraceae bacterium]|nr:hypothetical protein [Lachnospiraceae bacterium]
MSEETYENGQIPENNGSMTDMSEQTMYQQAQNQTNDYNTYQNGNYQSDNMGYNNGNAYQNMGSSGMNNEAWKQQYINPQQQKKEGGNGFGIAALILGIISLILFCTCINIPLAILAIIFAIVQMVKGGKSGAGKGMAIAGLITGIASLVCFIVFYVMIAVGIVDAGSDFYYDTPYEYFEEDFEDDIDDFFDDLSYSVGDAI